MSLTKPHTLCQRITHFPSPRRRVRVYWTDVVAVRCTWEHLGARWITVERSGKNIIFGNAAGAPQNHSYYLSFNDYQNLFIQLVFSSMYLYINIATYLHVVYIWTGSARWSSAIQVAPEDANRVNSEILSQAVIGWVWRCNQRMRLSELRESLGGRDWASSEMHIEAVTERV